MSAAIVKLSWHTGKLFQRLVPKTHQLFMPWQYKLTECNTTNLGPYGSQRIFATGKCETGVLRTCIARHFWCTSSRRIGGSGRLAVASCNILKMHHINPCVTTSVISKAPMDAIWHLLNQVRVKPVDVGTVSFEFSTNGKICSVQCLIKWLRIVLQVLLSGLFKEARASRRLLNAGWGRAITL